MSLRSIWNTIEYPEPAVNRLSACEPALIHLYIKGNNYDVIIRYFTTWKINWVAMDRAQAVMASMKVEARIFFLFMYGPDARVLLITAQEKEMLKGMPLLQS